MEEQKRLEREADQRQKEKKKQEIEEMQLKIKQEKVDALKNTAVGKRAFADITNEVSGSNHLCVRVSKLFASAHAQVCRIVRQLALFIKLNSVP